MPKRSLTIVLVVLILPVGAAAAWMLTETALTATAGPEICTTCHTMEPFARTFRADVHGGNNPRGLAAQCTDCHLRHDNPARHLWTKARFSLHDLWAQLTYDLDAIDWRAGLAERERYVFDSGCLMCHRGLEAARGNNRAFSAHRAYFLREVDRQCVSCHQHVGHRGLAAALPPSPDEGANP